MHRYVRAGEAYELCLTTQLDLEPRLPGSATTKGCANSIPRRIPLTCVSAIWRSPAHRRNVFCELIATDVLNRAPLKVPFRAALLRKKTTASPELATDPRFRAKT